MKLKPADLAAIEARLNAATGDRWEWDSYSQILAVVEPGHALAFQDDDCEPPVAVVAIVCGGEAQIGHGDELGARAARDNAEFIAHAPTDVRDLLTEVRRLEAVVAAAREAVTAYTTATSEGTVVLAIQRLVVALDGDARPGRGGVGMTQTTWRALTVKETGINGVIPLHSSSSPHNLVRCTDGVTHDVLVPLEQQPRDRGLEWRGRCEGCRRRYRLRLEVGE